VECLAEEFLTRHRRGERPSVTEYVQRYPQFAEEIGDVFPALLLMEEIGPRPTESLNGDVPPQDLGDYEVLREVGRGGMGIVYEARHRSLGRRVALKVLPSRAAQDPVCLERFEREARAAAALHHTNIVPVFDVGQANGLHFYAMQLIEGYGLDKLLRRLQDSRSDPAASCPTVASEDSRLHYRSMARLAQQAAEALAHAHAHHILHRDIKPANLLLDQQGRVWLTDFGLAKEEGEDLTRTGDVLGTLRYLAPERFSGVANKRSDVYSLGLTLYELLCLRPAFDESDRGRLVKQVTEVEPPRPRALDPKVPRDLETIVLKAIAKAPELRYPSARELADDLQRFLTDRPILARRSGAWEQAWRWCRRNPLVASLLGAVAVLLVIVAVGALVAAYQFRALALEASDAKKETETKALEIQQSAERQERAFQLLQRGQDHHARGRLDKAVAELSEAVELRPDMPWLWQARGNVYADLHLFELAAQDFAQAFRLRLSNEASEWHTQAGLRLFLGDVDGYRQTCRDMADHFGFFAGPRNCWWLADACTLGPDSGVDRELVVRLAREALGSDPTSASYALTLGSAHLRAGHLTEALRILEPLAGPGSSRSNLVATHLLALLQFRLGNQREARQHLDLANRRFEAILEASRFTPFEFELTSSGDYDLLKQVVLNRQAQALFPQADRTTDLFCQVARARGRAVIGQLAEAERSFAAAIALQPNNRLSWLTRAMFWSQRGLWGKAAADFARADQLRALDEISDLGNWAIVQLCDGDREGCAATCRRLLEQLSTSKERRQIADLAWVCSLLPTAPADRATLVNLLARMASSDQDDAWYRFAAGAALCRAGQYQKAADHLLAAVAGSQPGSPGADATRALALFFLSLAQHQLGHVEQARQSCASASALMDQLMADALKTKPAPCWHLWAGCRAIRNEVEAAVR
jgi:serine/threonine protein kinase/Flp pilus assembly protein TadD